MNLYRFLSAIIFILISFQAAIQEEILQRNSENEIIKLSQDKWEWMANREVEKLKDLFHEKSQFVHMGGSWGKEREVEIIRSGGIHYKNAEIHNVSVDVMGNIAILLNRITLLAVVGGNEVTNPFVVTEVYKKENGNWKLANMSFVRQLTRPEE
ncbi:nuclear transport factor 2 family protein [Salinimicrobium sp. WS361]|uniref:nuclear transport factor 2 family protein n=1 Tax=Salinimicrobium sp. WS361 TaxID=3425123 RepID=UPI003D6E9981